MAHKNPRQTARTHPMPFKSPLWDHLDTIRAMRRAKHTWEEIAEHIGKIQGAPIHHTTIYNFFKRYADRLQKKGRGQALGFEPLPGETAPPAKIIAPAPVQPASAQPSAKTDAEDDWTPVEDPTDRLPPNTRRKLEEMRKNQPKQS